MKKLLAVLLTLLMLFALPLCTMAAEVDTTEDTVAVGGEETTASDPAETEPTEDETYRCTCENCVTEETETEAPTTQKITFGFFPGTLSQTLPIMGMGMLGIFLVTSVIILAVLVLSKMGKKDED